jgi:predicted ATPase
MIVIAAAVTWTYKPVVVVVLAFGGTFCEAETRRHTPNAASCTPQVIADDASSNQWLELASRQRGHFVIIYGDLSILYCL